MGDTACEDCGARLTKFDSLKAMKARGETTSDRMLNSRSHREELYKRMKAQSEQFDKRMKALEDSYKRELQALDEVKEAEPKLAPELHRSKYLDPQFDLDREYEERVAKRLRSIEETSANH